MKIYTKQLQKIYKMLVDYYIKTVINHTDIREIIKKHRELSSCSENCWCRQIEDILDS